MSRNEESLVHTLLTCVTGKLKRFLYLSLNDNIVRTDRYLWAIRLFKTRSLAARECQAGKVKRHGKNLKPSSKLQVGDHLEVPSPDGTHKRLIEVVELLEKRVSAPLAQAAYQDHTSAEVLAEAEKRREDRRTNREARQEGDQGRLTKKRRRLWEGRNSF